MATAYDRWPGTVGSAAGTPARAPGSIRRTSTVDMVRPDGADGELVLIGRGRDLATGIDGSATVLDEAAMRATVDYRGGRRVVAIETDPHRPEVAGLVGLRAGGGFRRVVDEAMPDLAPAGALLYLLLDEVPVTTMISGVAFSVVGSQRVVSESNPLPKLDVCAGWVASGTLARSAADGTDFWHPGPAAPALDDPDDPLGWPPVDPLSPGTVRRRRRMDLLPPDRPGGPVVVDTHFRDSAATPEGLEVVVHEYSLVATVDPTSLVLASADVAARVLPGPECPHAVASAGLAVGRPLADLRRFVGETFPGPASCTHLNDMLRALGDLGPLVRRTVIG